MRWLWRLLTITAIVWAASISGAWLNKQMADPLPWWWGWPGAAIAGVAVFGGVNLVMRGDRRGWIVVAAGATAEIWFDFQYFGATHGVITSAILGIFPTVVAIMGGVVEASVEARTEEYERQREIDREERNFQLQLQREEREREHQLKLAQLEARTQLKMAQLRPQSSRNHRAMIADNAIESATESAKGRAFALLDSDPDISNRALAEALGVSESAARSYRSQWRKAREVLNEPATIHRNGNGVQVLEG